ncbi:MAG: ATP-binding cassette domain-containing protein [Candidatus Hydrogenedentota bacterium]|nr:MAG: ATP-binding cassette domain-containing protein [Candidatus Hydrogenedentota bacterium]
MIITLDLCLRHGDHEIIDGLNLHVEKGEFVFICGQAGSGKTSLLRILALQQMPAGGRVIVEGRDISKIARHEFPEYRRGLGVIFQDDLLLPHHTLAENIIVSLELAGWHVSDAKKETLTYLTEIGLLGKADLFPGQVSENEKQKLKICRALARRPKIVLADEPYEGLDGQSIEKAAELFNNANLRGSTVVIATHHVEFASRLGKRAIMLDRSSLGRMHQSLAT